MAERFKAWITKYALSSGIIAIEAEDCFGINPNMIKKINDRDEYFTTCFHSPDWHRTRESAVARANDMREKKIIALQKQIIKLGKMRFE